MGKVKFILFSDIQIEDWSRFSVNHSRLHDNGIILGEVFNLCVKYKCPAIFTGDFLDNPKYLKNRVLNHVFKWLNLFREENINIYMISGNHDQSEKNSINHTSPSYINMLSDIYPNIINLDLKRANVNTFLLSGIPYMSDDSDTIKAIKKMAKKTNPKKKNILMLHTTLPGAKEPNGFEVETNLPKNLYKYLKKFDLVISGHIHKPQKIFSNTYNLGATHHQRSSDADAKMGIWLLNKDLSLKFKPLKNIPRFRYYEEGEDHKETNDFWIEVPKEEEQEEIENLKFKPKSSPKKLAKEYLAVKNIKSKTKLKTLIKYLHADGLD